MQFYVKKVKLLCISIVCALNIFTLYTKQDIFHVVLHLCKIIIQKTRN